MADEEKSTQPKLKWRKLEVKPVTPLKWTKNVAKSLGLTVIEVAEDNMSSFKSFKEANNDFFKDIYQASKSPKKFFKSVLLENKYVVKAIEGLNIGLKGIIEDAVSGNLYNTERENQMTDDMTQSMMGDMFGEDMNLSENYDDDMDMTEDDVSDSKEDFNEAKHDAQHNEQVETTKEVGKSVTDAVYNSTQYMGQMSEISITTMQKGFTDTRLALSSGFSKTSLALDSINKVLSDQAVSHFQNSYKYYEESIKTQKEITSALNEMLGYQRQIYEEKQTKESENDYNKIMSGGMPDLKEYIKTIGKNIKSNFSMFDLIMGDTMGEGTNMLAMLLASPYKLVMPMALEALMSNRLKTSMESFNDTLSNLFANFLGAANRYSRDSSKNGILRKIAEQLVVKEDSTGIDIDSNGRISGISTAVNTKPMQYNGIAQKAITSVIPEYLARIEAAITGADQRIFDYSSGMWKTKATLRKEFEDRLNSEISSRTMSANYRAQSMVGDVLQDSKNGVLITEHKEYYDAIIEDITSMLLRSPEGYDKSKYNEYLKNTMNICKTYNRALGRYKRKINEGEAKFLLDLVLSDKSFISSLERKRREWKQSLSRLSKSDLTQYSSLVDGSEWLAAGSSIGFGGGSGESTGNLTSRLQGHQEDYYYNPKRKGYKNLNQLTKDNGDKLGKAMIKDSSGKYVIANGASEDAFAALTKEIIDAQNEKAYQNKIRDWGKDRGKRGELKKAKEDLQKGIDSHTMSPDDIEKKKKEIEELEKQVEREEASKTKLKDMDLFDKLEVFKNKLSDLLTTPSDAIASMIEKADSKMFDLFFDKEIEVTDSKGNTKKVNGFLDYLLAKTEDSFDRFGKWFGETFLGKKANDTVDNLKDSIMNSTFVNQYKDAFRRYTGSINEKFKSDTEKLKNAITSSVDEIKNLQDKEEESTDPKESRIWKLWEYDGRNIAVSKLGEEKVKKIELENGKTSIPPDPEKFYNYLKILYSVDENDNPTEGETTTPPSYAHGKYPAILSQHELFGQRISDSEYKLMEVPSLGVYDVTPGSFVIPNSKKQQVIDAKLENEYKKRLKKNIPSYGEGKDNDQENKNDKETKEAAEDTADDILSKLKEAAEASKGFTSSKLFDNAFFRNIGTTITNKDEKEVSEDLRKAGNAAPSIVIKMLGNGLVGALLGFPILSALGTGAAEIIKSSSKLSEKMFGKALATDEEGNVTEREDNGYIPKWLQDFFKKTAPDLRIFGAGGAIAGILFPQIGIPGGILIGSATALLKNNESVNRYLFGELVETGELDKNGNPIRERDNSGLISGKAQRFFKKSLPNVIPASLLGMIFNGPFGPVGGMMLGAGVGMLMKTESFGDLILGKRDPNDKEGKKRLKGTGLVGALYKVTVKPLGELVKDICKDVMDFLKNDIAKPIKNFLSPLADVTKNTISDIGLFLKANIDDFMYSYVGMPMELWTETFAGNLTKVATSTIRALMHPGKFLASLPFKVIGGIGNRIRGKQIEKGTALSMSAKERVEWAKEHKTKSNPLDIQLTEAEDKDVINLNKGMQAVNMRGDYSQKYIEAAENIKYEFTLYLQSTESELHPGKSLMDVMGSIIGMFGGKKGARLIEYYASGDNQNSFQKVDNELNKMVNSGKISTDELNRIEKKLVPMMKEVRDGIIANNENRELPNKTLKLFTRKTYNNNTSLGRFLNKRQLGRISTAIAKEAEEREKNIKQKEEEQKAAEEAYKNSPEGQQQMAANETRKNILSEVQTIVVGIDKLLKKAGDPEGLELDKKIELDEEHHEESAYDRFKKLYSENTDEKLDEQHKFQCANRVLALLNDYGYISIESSDFSEKVMVELFEKLRKTYGIDYTSIDKKKEKDLKAELHELAKIAEKARKIAEWRTYNDTKAIYEELKIDSKNLIDIMFNHSYKEFKKYIKHVTRARTGLFGVKTDLRRLKAMPVYAARGVKKGASIVLNKFKSWSIKKANIMNRASYVANTTELKEINKELNEILNAKQKNSQDTMINNTDHTEENNELDRRYDELTSRKVMVESAVKAEKQDIGKMGLIMGSIFGTKKLEDGNYSYGNIFKEGIFGKFFKKIKTLKEGLTGLPGWKSLFGDPDANNEYDRMPLIKRTIAKFKDNHPKLSSFIGLVGKALIAIPVIGHLSTYIKDTIKPFIVDKVWPKVKSFFSNLWDDGEGGGIKNLLPNMKDTLLGYEKYSTVTGETEYVGGILSPIANLWSNFKNWWNNESKIGEFFKILMGKSTDEDGKTGFFAGIKYIFSGVINWFKTGYTEFGENIWSPLCDKYLKPVLDFVMDAFGEGLSGIISNAINPFKSAGEQNKAASNRLANLIAYGGSYLTEADSNAIALLDRVYGSGCVAQVLASDSELADKVLYAKEISNYINNKIITYDSKTTTYTFNKRICRSNNSEKLIFYDIYSGDPGNDNYVLFEQGSTIKVDYIKETKKELIEKYKKVYGISATGRNNHIYQNDPRIANMSFGKAATIGEAGCGPVAVTNMANSLGYNMSLGSATKQALKYQDSTGGTTTDYIGSALNSAGINTYNTSNSNDLKSALKRGQSAVLMGQDYSDGAYGSNNHYINAMGYDKSGKNIIVEDPDLPQSRVMYPEKQVLNNMKHATITAKGRKRKPLSGKGKYNFSDKNSVDYLTLKYRTMKLIKDHEAGKQNPVASINKNDANSGFSFGISQFHGSLAATVLFNIIEKIKYYMGACTDETYYEYEKLLAIAEKMYNKVYDTSGLTDDEADEFYTLLTHKLTANICKEAEYEQLGLDAESYLEYPLRLYNKGIINNPSTIALIARTAPAGPQWAEYWSRVYTRYYNVANNEPGFKTYVDQGIPLGLGDISNYKTQTNSMQELYNVNESMKNGDSYLGNDNKIIDEYHLYSPLWNAGYNTWLQKKDVDNPPFRDASFENHTKYLSGWKSNIFTDTYKDIGAWDFDEAVEAKEYLNMFNDGYQTNTVNGDKIKSSGYLNTDSSDSSSGILSGILSAFTNAFTSLMDLFFGKKETTDTTTEEYDGTETADEDIDGEIDINSAEPSATEENTESTSSDESVATEPSATGRFKDMYSKLSPQDKYQSIVSNAAMLNRIDPSTLKSSTLRAQLSKFKSLSKTRLGLDTSISKPSDTNISTIQNSNGTTSYNVESATGRYSGTGSDEYIAILNVIVGILSTIANNSADISLILDFLVEKDKLSGKAREDIEKELKERQEKSSKTSTEKKLNIDSPRMSLNTDVDGLLSNNENLRSIMNLLAKGI